MIGSAYSQSLLCEALEANSLALSISELAPSQIAFTSREGYLRRRKFLNNNIIIIIIIIFIIIIIIIIIICAARIVLISMLPTTEAGIQCLSLNFSMPLIYILLRLIIINVYCVQIKYN